MTEIIAAIILIGSLLGMGIIIRRKLPLVSELPETVLGQKEPLAKIKNLLPVKGFSSEIFLQKMLSKIRILTLKTENKTSNWLQKLREKSKKRKLFEEDDYWQKLKDSAGKKPE